MTSVMQGRSGYLTASDVLSLQGLVGNGVLARSLLKARAVVARQPAPAATAAPPDAATPAAADAEPRFTLEILGQRHADLTRDAALAQLSRHKRWVAGMIDVGVDTHDFLRKNREEHNVVGWISDKLGGVALPEMGIWSEPRRLLADADAALQAGNVESAARLLDDAEKVRRRCEQVVYRYREGTISGAEVAENIAIGVAVTCAVVFVVAGAGATGAGAVGTGAAAAGAVGAKTAAAGTTAAGAAAATAGTGTVAAATAGLGGEVTAAAGGAAVTAEASAAAGVVNATGRLFPVLQGVQSGFAAMAPRTALQALSVVQRAVASVGLEVGIASTLPSGAIVLTNVGGVTTYLLANGQILIMRGSQVILHLIP